MQHTDRNDWGTIAQENHHRSAIGLKPRAPKPHHPADGHRRAERWIIIICILSGMATAAAFIFHLNRF